jgi:type III secretory pathway component EscT
MTDDLARDLPRLLSIALAVLRLFPLALALPFLGGRWLPTWARIPVLLALAVGAWPALLQPPTEPVTVQLQFVLLAAVREISLGLALALIVAVPFFALEHAGRILDSLRGFQHTETEVSPLANLLRWTFGLTFLSAGGLRSIVRLIAGSYGAFPPSITSSSIPDLARLSDAAAHWTAISLSASVTLVSAAWIALLASEMVLALTVRMAPALSGASMALPFRVLVPLAVIALGVGVWTGASAELMRSALRAAAGLNS